MRARGIHHLGVAVEDLGAAVETYERRVPDKVEQGVHSAQPVHGATQRTYRLLSTPSGR